jgi:hypothetical protein
VDETATSDKDPRQPTSGRCSGGGSTRRHSTARLCCYDLQGKERVSGSDRSTRQRVGDSPAEGDARAARSGIGDHFNTRAKSDAVMGGS